MRDHRALGIALAVLIAPTGVFAHSKGMYPTKKAALEQASKLGCQGAHQNNGGHLGNPAWMPCLDEADLHRAQRRQ